MRQGSGSVTAKKMLLVFACAVLLSVQAGKAQRGTTSGEWRHYGGDAGGTKYSPLDQINASNVNKLQIAWRWKTSGLGQAPDFNWQATPLMIGDTLYFTAGPGDETHGLFGSLEPARKIKPGHDDGNDDDDDDDDDEGKQNDQK